MSEHMRSTNGSAFQKEEQRFGPPLDYIASKIHESLIAQHRLYRDIEKLNNKAETKNAILSEMHESFHKSVVAYAGLLNMLNITNDKI